MLERLLKDFMDDHDCEQEFHEDTPGEWNFYIDNNHSMSLAQDGQEIHFRCTLCDTPTRLSTLETLLNANFLGIATVGNIIGLDSEGQSVVLCRTVKSDLDYSRFEAVFEDFLNSALEWIEELSERKDLAEI